MDNLVVFSLIMTTYRVPPSLTRKAPVAHMDVLDQVRSSFFHLLTGLVCWDRGLCAHEAWFFLGSLEATSARS